MRPAWRSKEGGLSDLCSLISFIVSLQGPHQRSLLKNLLKDYNRMERPVANDSQPLTVVFTLSLIQIMDVVSLFAGMLPRFDPLQGAANPRGARRHGAAAMTNRPSVSQIPPR